MTESLDSLTAFLRAAADSAPPLQRFLRGRGGTSCPRCGAEGLEAGGREWRCPSCMARGGVLDLVADRHGVAGPFEAALDLGRDRIPLPAVPGLHGERGADLAARVLRDALTTWRTHFHRRVKPLLEERGVPPGMAAAQGFGWCPPRWLKDAGPEERRAAALAGLWDTRRDAPLLAGRVAIPLRDHEGRLVGFVGWHPLRSPRYLTSRRNPLWPGALLYGYREAQDACRSAGFTVVVEGYFDRLSLAAAGVHNTVALRGCRLSRGQALLLASLAPRALFMLDHDEPGRSGQAAAMRLLRELGMEAGSGASLYSGKDPDEAIQAGRMDLDTLLAWRKRCG